MCKDKKRMHSAIDWMLFILIWVRCLSLLFSVYRRAHRYKGKCFERIVEIYNNLLELLLRLYVSSRRETKTVVLICFNLFLYVIKVLSIFMWSIMYLGLPDYILSIDQYIKNQLTIFRSHYKSDLRRHNYYITRTVTSLAASLCCNKLKKLDQRTHIQDEMRLDQLCRHFTDYSMYIRCDC